MAIDAGASRRKTLHGTEMSRPAPAEEAPLPVEADIRALVEDVSGLVSPPEVCLRVTELLHSPGTSAADFARVIGHDPSLSARLLRVVNSPYFGFGGRIDTISRTVALLGLRELHALVMAASAVTSFSRLSNRLVNMDTFWRHSVLTGLLARGLASRADVLHPERLFVAGLLHDVGSLVLFHRLPDVMRDLLLVADGDEALLCQVETDTLGFNHADVGAHLFALWHLPPSLVEAVRDHHRPESGAGGRETSMVHIAERLASYTGIASLLEGPQRDEPIAPSVWTAAGLHLTGEELSALVADAVSEFVETALVLTG